jgi:hypothetical protein
MPGLNIASDAIVDSDDHANNLECLNEVIRHWEQIQSTETKGGIEEILKKVEEHVKSASK